MSGFHINEESYQITSESTQKPLWQKEKKMSIE
jgi:hypothetical protein